MLDDADTVFGPCSGEVHHSELLMNICMHLHKYRIMHNPSRLFRCDRAAIEKSFNAGTSRYRKYCM